MKIAIVGPGISEIPPKGWGAVEILIWDYKTVLENMGHEVLIVNTPNRDQIIKECNDYNPDFVHIQYDDFWNTVASINCEHKAITTHYGYLEQIDTHPRAPSYKQRIFDGFRNIADHCYIFCLSEGIKQTYIKHGFPEEKLVVAPNGCRTDLFDFVEGPLYGDRSLCLAKIDYRKRQAMIQNYDANVYFAGRIADGQFKQDRYYLGEWEKDYLYKNLTHYANLVLLSDGEADPLVTKEALAAGLGLVLSQYSVANLDLDLPYIDVITEDKMGDKTYVKNIIEENRIKSYNYRRQIRQYAVDNLDWNTIVEKYIEKVHNIMR